MRAISRSRAGRKSWQTRVNYTNAVGDAVKAMANAPQPKYGDSITRAMIIERTANGKTEVITFSQSYGELSMWLDKSFANISESGFSDMLAETFFQGAKVCTAKAEYRLWLKEPAAPVCGCRYDGIWCVYFCDAHYDEQMRIDAAEEADEMRTEYFHTAGEIERIYQEVV